MKNEFDKKFLLRLSPALFATLNSEATRAGVSINSTIVSRLLAGAPSQQCATDELVRVVQSFSIFTNSPKLLQGIVLFGSGARDELSAHSDIDLLVVMDRSFEITRAIYRLWDTEIGETQWRGYPISVHFVSLPETTEGASLGSLWLEASIEGIILVEQERRISHTLRSIRLRCLAGEFQRRYTHGIPYWVGREKIDEKDESGVDDAQ